MPGRNFTCTVKEGGDNGRPITLWIEADDHEIPAARFQVADDVSYEQARELANSLNDLVSKFTLG